MGYTVSAHACFGIKIKIDDIPNLEARVRGCIHPETASPYCDQCGKDMWVTQELDYTETDLEERVESFGYEIREASCESDTLYIGSILDEGKGNYHQEPELFINDISHRFSDIPHEKGLFIYLYESY